MKKLISAILMMAAVSSSATAFAADVTYSTDNSVSSTAAAGKSTVLVTKGTSTAAEDIVYVNQADTAFEATTQFFLKNSVEEGSYTITLGGNGEAVKKTFNIGLSETLGDIAMTSVGHIEVDGKYNIGYKATAPGEYNTLLVKKADGTYLGCTLDTTLTGGSDVVLGVQINGVDNLSDISAVYLSTRTINGDTVGGAE